MAGLGGKMRVAVLQPFLKRASRPLPGSQEQLTATPTYGDAVSKLEEAVALVDTLGCEVVFKEVVPLRSVHPKFLFGSGKASEMAGAVSAADADTVFVNAPLSGQQQKALSSKWGGSKVLDRFRVILDIFADRARTTEAKLQVELAGLKYQASHLVKGAKSGYDRQRGGLGAVGGSGEKAIETQRRLLRDRTAEVNRLLNDVERRRGYQRGARDRRLEPTVALVGYTNVGKSSLLNELALARHSRRVVGGGGGGRGLDTSSGGTRGGGEDRGKGMVHARNRLFDTLDPTVRSVSLPSRTRCVLVDTVGFIQDLPTDLVLSFKSTLEEVKHADVLLHVRDASVEPRVYEAQRRAVEETLGELGASGVPTLEVWNKVDMERAIVPPSSFNDDDADAAHGGNGGGRRGGSRGDMSLPDDEGGLTREGGDVGAAGISSNDFGRVANLYPNSSSSSGNNRSSRSAAGDSGEGGDGQDSIKEASRGGSAPPKSGPDDRNAVRVSAATGQGLAHLLERLDAMLHLSGGGDAGGRRFAAKPVDRYQYVRVLPGQSQERHK
eukprot:g6736.t1